MNALLAQFILLARGNDGGWMQILVLVLVAAVYGLGTILKVKKGKKEQEQAEEEQGRKPQRKPEGGRGLLEQFVREIQRAVEPTEGRDRESRPAVQPAPKKIARPQPAPTVRKYAAEAKQASWPKPIIPPAKPKRPGLELSMPAPQVQPDFEELPEIETSMQTLPKFTTKAVERSVGKRKGMAEVPESKYLSEVLSDFTDPEDLRMAILHYEILGRPLSLRDPSGQIIGL